MVMAGDCPNFCTALLSSDQNAQLAKMGLSPSPRNVGQTFLSAHLRRQTGMSAPPVP
jgi:hypothetical protein